MSGSVQAFQTPTPATASPRSGWFMALGILFIVPGVLAWLDVMAATLVSTVVIGLMLIVAGLVQIAHALAHRGVTAPAAVFSGLIGVLCVPGGGTIIAEPVAGSVLLTAILAFCLVFAGVARMAWAAATDGWAAGGACCSAGWSPPWSAS